MSRISRLWLYFLTWCLLGWVNFAAAEDWQKPTWTKKLNNRTALISRAWEQPFDLDRPAHVVASIQIHTGTNWQDHVQPAILAGVAVDGRLVSHIVTYLGSEFHNYEVHLGWVPKGRRYLEILRADSSLTELKLVNLQLSGYEEEHPQYAILRHAPLIFGRRQMRWTDVPLLMTYECDYDSSLANENQSWLKSISYAVLYSNSDGGLPPAQRLHLHGRYTDFAFVYRVDLDENGNRRSGYFRSAPDTATIFRGGFENDQPTLQIISDDNVFSDSLTTKLRFSLPPAYALPQDGFIEQLMQEAPWAWIVSAQEARRELWQDSLPATARIQDLRRYLFLQFSAEPLEDGTACGGFFIAKFRNQPDEYASHLWHSELIANGPPPFKRQVAVPLPIGTGQDDLMRLEFVADPEGAGATLTAITQLFSLDENELPKMWRQSWQGKVALKPGERVRFYADGFELRQSRVMQLADEWYFKPDPWQQGGAANWGGGRIHESLWPRIQIGKGWQESGYPGYSGASWYRSYFYPDASWRGERLWLGFGEIDGEFEVWANGKPVPVTSSSALNRFDTFRLADLSNCVEYGKDNSVAVRIQGGDHASGITGSLVALSNIPEAFLQREWPMSEPQAIEVERLGYLHGAWGMFGADAGGGAVYLTPSGSLTTGRLAFDFLGGADSQPIEFRPAQLSSGFLPVLNYEASRQGIRYDLEVFSQPLNHDSLQNSLNYVQLNLHNTEAIPVQAKFGLRVRADLDERKVPPPHSPAKYKFVGRFLFEHEEVLCSMSETPTSFRLSESSTNGRSDPSGIVEYDLNLAAGETRSLRFCIPQNPINSARMMAAGGLTFDTNRLRLEVERQWLEFLKSGMEINLPEDKVVQALRASLIYTAMLYGCKPGMACRFPGKIAELAEAANAFGLMGLHLQARLILANLLARQQLDGSFAEKDAIDMNGAEEAGLPFMNFSHVLCALTQYVELSWDRGFASESLPAVRDACNWISDSYNSGALMLTEVPAGEAAISLDIGAFVLMGLARAQSLAEACGALQDQAAFAELHNELRNRYVALLERAAQSAQGLIPAAFGGDLGASGISIIPVYPGGVIDPRDERASLTLRLLRGKFQEGVLTRNDGEWLDGRNSFYVTQASLLRGEPETVVQDLYALLLHTTSTHLPSASDLRPWGNRQAPENARFDNLYASRLIQLVRSMLVQEDGRDVHLFAAVSPEWLKNGNRIEVTNCPTRFGPLSMRATSSRDKWSIEFQREWQSVPRYFLLHLPPFLEVDAILVDGRKLSSNSNPVRILPHTRIVEITGNIHADQSNLNYDTVVQDFEREYAGRYQLWQISNTGR